eukprot:4673835-Prymnesium_polylepis.1
MRSAARIGGAWPWVQALWALTRILMADDAEMPDQNPHQPFPSNVLGRNSSPPPGKRQRRTQESSMWKVCARLLTDNAPDELKPLLVDKTHVCTVSVPEGVCNQLLKLSKKDGRWSTSHGLPHYGAKHPESQPGREYNGRQQKAQSEKVQTQLLYNHPDSARQQKLDATTPIAAAFKDFHLTPEQRALSSQAMFIVYGNCHISERTLID